MSKHSISSVADELSISASHTKDTIIARPSVGTIGLISSIALTVYLMLLNAPLRLDDWAWGSSIGMNRLTSGFSGYNGRYLGNLCVLALTRIPAPIRAIVELATLTLAMYYAYHMLKKSWMAFVIFACLFVVMPLQIFTQTITWVSGFSNYGVSLPLMLFVISSLLQCDEEGLASKSQLITIPLITFIGQLFLENVSLCIVCVSLFFLVSNMRRNTSTRPLFLLIFTCAVIGAIIMFSNSAYSSAATGDGETYKSIAVVSGGITESAIRWVKSFANNVLPYWIANCTLLFIVLLIGIILRSITVHAPNHFLSLGGAFFLGLVAYTSIDNDWQKYVPAGLYVKAAIYVCLCLFILVAITKLFTASDKRRALIILCSQIPLTGPLLFADPIAPRCFLASYALWCILAGQILTPLIERGFTPTINSEAIALRTRASALLPLMFVLSVLVWSMLSQSFAWRVQRIRTEIIEDALTHNANKIVLPEVPNSSEYCYGINIANDNTYWIGNYKRYYGIPQDVSLSFRDYYKFMEERNEG